MEQAPPNGLVVLKQERPQPSNPFIAELMEETYSIKLHPTTARDILIEVGKYIRSRGEGARRFALRLRPLVKYTRWILPQVSGLREAINKYGLFNLLYLDNDSKFKVIRRY